MSGIAGWVNLKVDLSSKQEIIKAMSKTLIHRGPISSGLWISAHALLAHRGMWFIDQETESQPLTREFGDSKYTITYNGKLYNAPDLKEQLLSKGHIFTENSDAEVILAAYLEWGTGCLEHFNGMYAFGLWHEKEQCLFLARDRFGVKPFFYALRGDSLIFGSEIKAILAHPDVRPEIDTAGLGEIFGVGPARTPGSGIFKGIHEVKPAHFVLFNSQGIREKSYWSLVSAPHEDSLEETLNKVRSLLINAITRQLRADVPVCTFLSGGLDSSVITAAAAENLGKYQPMHQEEKRLHTYSLDFIDNDRYYKPSLYQPNSDAPWVKRVSKEFNTRHRAVYLDTPELAEALVDATYAHDHPGMVDGDASFWLFSREIRKDFQIALSGEFSDEIFGGYPWLYREEMLFENTFPWSRHFRERLRILSPALIDQVQPVEYLAGKYQEALDMVPRLSGENPQEARQREICYLGLSWFGQTLINRGERMSMAHGLEIRMPFTDHLLAQYVWNIPWSMKILKGREKGLLRKALKGLLPDDVLNRRKSAYPKTHNPSYEQAVKKWSLEILNDPSTPIRDLFNEDAVRTLAAGEADYGKPWFGQLMAGPQLFSNLIQIYIWFKKYKVTIV